MEIEEQLELINTNGKSDKERRPSSIGKSGRVRWLVLIVTTIVALSKAFLSKLTFLRVLTIQPVLVCALIAFRARTWEHRLLPLALVVTVVLGQLPVFLGAAVAAASITLFSLATLNRERAKPSMSAAKPIIGTALLVLVLLTENFMVWVVSATFEPGHNPKTTPPPLQDNGQILIRKALADLTHDQVVSLRRLWNVQWSLVALLGAAFITVELFLHPRRQLYSLGLRAILTLACARMIRTCSFLMTVLPSQVSNCYAKHYPNPPPTNAREWILVGLKPASAGGCNDLIISGHATVTSMLACVAASVSGSIPFAVSLWILVALDYTIEIYEGFHYSVDMWLGMVIVILLWRVLRHLEVTADLSGAAASSGQVRSTEITAQNIFVYSVPSVVAYLQVTVFPKSFANAVIALYAVTPVILFLLVAARQNESARKQTYTHLAQHTLFLLLFIGFAVYL